MHDDVTMSHFVAREKGGAGLFYSRGKDKLIPDYPGCVICYVLAALVGH